MSGLYIHIPFCKSKCFYCSFSSYEKKDELTGPYLEALGSEALHYIGSTFDTVYIGGGTPSYLSIPELKILFEAIRSGPTFKKDPEVTIEANPATFDADSARALFDLGVNRVSLGCQSLNDKYLKFLGRPHNRKQAISAFELLKKSGFKNISLDLIYSLPDQNLQEIKDDVLGLLSLGSQHISLYTLSISEGSEFYRRQMGSVPPEKQSEDYMFVRHLILDAGFEHYEVSNFAKKGFECRHNVNYWQGGDYIGLGSAAHSHMGGRRFWNISEPEAYILALNTKGSAKAGEEKLSGQERFMEAFLIGLRLTEGVDIMELGSRFNTKLTCEKEEQVSGFVRDGLLVKDRDRIKVSMSGMVVLDEICSRLI